MVTTVFTVLPPANALAIFGSRFNGSRFNLSGHGLAPMASTFDPQDRSTTLTQTRTFQAGPTEGRAFFFHPISDAPMIAFTASLSGIPCIVDRLPSTLDCPKCCHPERSEIASEANDLTQSKDPTSALSTQKGARQIREMKSRGQLTLI
jgi:hypothetical protein